MTSRKKRPRSGCWVALLLCLMGVFAPVIAAQNDIPMLESRDGTATVSWKADYSGYAVLTVSSSPNKVVATYPVTETQSWVLSGLPNGNYTLALTSPTQPPLPVAELSVHHYPLKAAFGLFSMGMLMFAYLLFTLVRANRGAAGD